jgi:hypothetical protein
MSAGLSQRRISAGSTWPVWLESRALSSAQTNIEDVEDVDDLKPSQTAEVIRLPTRPMSLPDEIIMQRAGFKVKERPLTQSEELLIWEAPMQAATATQEERSSQLVEVSAIATVGGQLAALVSILAILVYALTGFAMIHPVVAMFTLIGGAAFYSMGRITQARHTQAK